MGGMKSQTCSNIAFRIWDFCTKNQLWVSAAHIPGTINIEVDKQSRVLEDATEWKLNPALFHKIVEKFGKPDIDLFATRISSQLERYVSWHPEPETMAINAISLTWSNNYLDMFKKHRQDCEHPKNAQFDIYAITSNLFNKFR